MFNLFTLNMPQQSWGENLELFPVPRSKVKSVSQGVCIIRPLPHTGLICSHFSHMFYVVTELKSISSLQYFSSLSFVGYVLFHIVSAIWKVHRYSYSTGKQLVISQKSVQCLEHSRCSISNCLLSTQAQESTLRNLFRSSAHIPWSSSSWLLQEFISTSIPCICYLLLLYQGFQVCIPTCELLGNCHRQNSKMTPKIPMCFQTFFQLFNQMLIQVLL